MTASKDGPKATRGRRARTAALTALVACCIVVGCAGPEQDPPRAPSPVVLAISVDGLNPDAVEMAGRDGAPSLWRLVDEGTSTFNARTTVELTSTLPNHASMLTGRSVEGRFGTSVTANDDDGGTLAEMHGGYVPGMLDVAHDRGLRTALFAEKDKFRFLVRSWDGRHGARDETGADGGRNKLDATDIAPAEELADQVTSALVEDETELMFWHVAAPDAAGHADGWLSDGYVDAVRHADRQIGQVLAALDRRPGLKARTTVILTSDHGGARGARSHDQPERLANYRVPFIVWGRGVGPGTDLYAVNPAREDPGTPRPGYSGPQPVRNLDLADTALTLLGLPETPGAPTAKLGPLAVR